MIHRKLKFLSFVMIVLAAAISQAAVARHPPT